MFFALLLTFASYPVFSAGQTCGTKPDLYCKLNNLEQRISRLETIKEPHVEYLATGFEILGTDVTFPNVVMNNGNGYNRTTGQFKAPVAGMYYIAATLSPAQEKDYQKVQCYVQKNGVSILDLFSDKFGAHEVGSYQITATMPVYLAIDDVVSVGACTSYEGIHNDHGTSFNGILLYTA
ncbi:complement C1q tumor necrosis factor-related protein 3-like [Mercenaria mercenaria]|uniref:complement C1q tumor necrosis factor-related protein 3-like n=1 Tax=Mercenaria mercenaria TaxID=6596 RepID=UPI001E1DAB2C|nr:complement C1q tumor necrosis factor-related protein 3-like [Mercenaria mercenaria]